MLTIRSVDGIELAEPLVMGGGRPASRRAPARKLADPAAHWWTLRDLAALFGRADIGRQVQWWRAHHGFPAPLPWSRGELRFNPQAVLGWKARQESARQESPRQENAS